MRNVIIPLLFLAAAPAVAYADANPAQIDVESSAFKNNEPIPVEYTCQGTNISPPLSWSRAPAPTKSIAVLVEDPDAPKGTFTHWLVTGIPATATTLDKGAALPAGAMAAKNDKGQAGYTGPCPPSGRHHYHFRVYALDISLPKTMTRANFQKEISGHVIATGDLVGTYQRQTGR